MGSLCVAGDVGVPFSRLGVGLWQLQTEQSVVGSPTPPGFPVTHKG